MGDGAVTSSEAAGRKPQATGRREAAGRSLRGIAFQGAALFLFIPFVLFLFLRQPLGPGWSVAVGLAIMLGHRFIAAPWMAKFADVRCLWCGRVGVSHAFPILAGGRTWTMSACSAEHAGLVARVLRFVQRFRVLIAIGIFVPLAWLVLASLAAAAGRPLLPHQLNALLFRVVVAVTVVTAATVPSVIAGGKPAVRDVARDSERGPRGQQPLRCPFPLHNLFLLGLGKTLWVFRIVGAWWIVDALVRLSR